MFYRLFKFTFAITLVAGFAYIVRYTEKPWPLIEGQSLVHQVAACQFINLKTGIENYKEAINVLEIRLNLETAVDLAVNGPPGFGRRYNCFANLNDQEISTLTATKEYADIQYEIQRQLAAFNSPHRGL